MIGRHRRLFWLLLIAIGVAPVLGMMGGSAEEPLSDLERGLYRACLDSGGRPMIVRDISNRAVACITGPSR